MAIALKYGLYESTYAMKQASFTAFIECLDKAYCRMAVKDFEKRQRKFIRAIHETVPFTNVEGIKSRLENPTSVRLGKADFIIEVAARKFNELESVKRDVESHFPSNVASLSIT